jgi:type III restriction enzyme
MVEIANFTIQMTATPKGYNDLIELKDEDLLNDGVMLLKNTPIYNEFQTNTSTSNELIRECIKKFKKVQNEYKKLTSFIRPALLIQVDSKNKNITQEEYDKTIEKIINIVSNEEKLKYLKYFSNDIKGNAKEDLTLESASKNDSNYDVIIFKVGPATG